MTPGVETAALMVDGLTVQGRRGDTWTDVLHDVGFAIGRGEIVGLVGESGSGKSTTAYAVFGYARPGMRIATGRVTVDDTNILACSPRRRRALRGRGIGLVPQNPGTAFTPSKRVGRILQETLRVHKVCSSAGQARARALALLDEVGIPSPETLARRYPHQLSGGQLQRVAIAAALACEPALLVLDEPTTALDVTTQAKVVRVLARLRATHRVGMLYVTHDLGILGQLCDRVAVMYDGRLVEVASTETLFTTPQHPYTRMLMGSLPGLQHLDPGEIADRVADKPEGCRFAGRCPFAQEECRFDPQQLEEVAAGHWVACERWRSLADQFAEEQPQTRGEVRA